MAEQEPERPLARNFSPNQKAPMNYEQEIKQLKSDRATILKMLEKQQRTLEAMAKTVKKISEVVTLKECTTCWGTGEEGLVSGGRIKCDRCKGTGKVAV